jgi:hypothetical protein
MWRRLPHDRAQEHGKAPRGLCKGWAISGTGERLLATKGLCSMEPFMIMFWLAGYFSN